MAQDWRPISFHSQVLKGRSLYLSTYEKELLALVTAVQKWRPYLLGKPFVIKTVQQNLKYLLEQKIGTPVQQKWITKILGYLFKMEYKKGRENRIADALSRKESVQAEQEVMSSEQLESTPAQLFVLSFPCPTRIEELRTSYGSDRWCNNCCKTFTKGRIRLNTIPCRMDYYCTRVKFIWDLLAI